MTKAVCLIFTLAFPSLSLQGVASQTGGFQAGVPRPTQVFKTISRGSLRPSGFHNTKRLPAFSTVLAFAPMVRKRWWAKCWHLWRHPASGPRLPCGRRALRLRPRAVETGSFTQDRFDEAGKMAPSANALLTCTALASARRGRERARPAARGPLPRRLQEEQQGCQRTSRVSREQFLPERTADRQLWLCGPGHRTGFSLKTNVVSLWLQGKQLINSICYQR